MKTVEELAELLTSRSWTVAVAESCTGGLLGHLITSVPGSSEYFQGGMTAYSNTAKIDLLGITQDCLRNHGSVSERTALAMATGVRDAFQVDLGIGITGIAGPGGGTEQKPVGTVYVAVAGDLNEKIKTLALDGSRDDIKLAAAEAALEFACEFLRERES